MLRSINKSEGERESELVVVVYSLKLNLVRAGVVKGLLTHFPFSRLVEHLINSLLFMCGKRGILQVKLRMGLRIVLSQFVSDVSGRIVSWHSFTFGRGYGHSFTSTRILASIRLFF